MLVFKNLWMFFRHHTLLFLLITLTQVVAVVVILFSYGVYMNNQYEINEDGYYATTVGFRNFPEGSSALVRDAFPELLVDTGNLEKKLKEVVVYTGFPWEYSTPMSYIGGEISIYSYFGLQDGQYTEAPTMNNFRKFLQGELYSVEDMNQGEKICVVGYTVDQYLKDIGTKTVTLGGEEYRIVAYKMFRGGEGLDDFSILLPPEVFPEGLEISSVEFFFYDPLLRSEYEELKARAQAAFGDGIEFDEFYKVPVDEEKAQRSMMLSAVFLALIAAFSACLIYRYLLETRLGMTAIYRICGSSESRSICIYLVEMLLLLTVTTVTGCLLYAYWLEPRMEPIFYWFEVIHQDGFGYRLIGVYFVILVVLMVGMITMTVRQMPKEMLRRR